MIGCFGIEEKTADAIEVLVEYKLKLIADQHEIETAIGERYDVTLHAVEHTQKINALDYAIKKLREVGEVKAHEVLNPEFPENKMTERERQVMKIVLDKLSIL